MRGILIALAVTLMGAAVYYNSLPQEHTGILTQVRVLQYKVHATYEDGKQHLVADYFKAVSRREPYDTLTEANFKTVEVHNCLSVDHRTLNFWRNNDGSVESTASIDLYLEPLEGFQYEEHK